MVLDRYRYLSIYLSISTYTHTHYLFARLFKSHMTQIHANLIEATVQTYQGLKQAQFLICFQFDIGCTSVQPNLLELFSF